MKNKTFRTIAVLALTAVVGFTQTSCMGSFKLLRSLYSWNESATDNKIANNIIFWAFNIIPVYSIAVFVDAVVLNLIEFWTGSNPIAMNPGDVEEQLIVQNGKEYTLRASLNTFEVVDADGVALTLNYTPNNQTWNLNQDGELTPLAQNLENGQVKVFYPNGTSSVFDNNANAFALAKSEVAHYNAMASK